MSLQNTENSENSSHSDIATYIRNLQKKIKKKISSFISQKSTANTLQSYLNGLPL